MAYAFGDSSYLKLPPITGESAVEIDGENSKRSSSGVVRDTHGLVRLPPIVRLDSLRSSPSSAQALPKTPAENEFEMSRQRSNLKISHKMDPLRQGSSKKLRKYAEKREDEKKLIQTPAAKETDKLETSVFDSKDWSRAHEKARRFRSKERSGGLQGDYEALSIYKDSFGSRRGSATFKSTVKLSRSRRLAKSSPELSLCNRKINLKNGAVRNVHENTATTLPAGLSPENCSRTSHARLSIHDIDGSVLSRLQNTAKMDEKLTKRGRSQKVGQSTIYQPLSTPNSPVCSESANKEHKKKSRKSLNDITETVKQFIDRRRPSISPPKKQNLVDETVGLKIEGKSCPHAESRELVGELTYTPTVANVNSLQPPQNNEKRHSLYDLQQILSLLQREELKRHPSSTSNSPPQSSSAGSNGNDTGKPTNASVYDLREFLKLAVAVEATNGKPMKNPLTDNLSAGKTQGEASSAGLLSPKQERREHHRDGTRKGSVYDLMEFLSLGNNGDSASASTSENSSRSASPRILFSPRSSKEMLFVSEPTEARRSSTYDLMEFLSLPRSGGTSRPESGQSSTSTQGNQPSSNNLENEYSGTDKNRREARSLSVYDLAEYLAMTTGVPPLVRVTTSDEEQTEIHPTALDSNGGERGNAYKRESVYDLREMLNVMQQENERKRESLYNLPEILSYFHREADAKEKERETATESANSCEEKKATLNTPSSPTISSGYSSDSPSSITDSNSLQANNTSASRQMSVYDLREFLSLYAAQKSSPNQQTPLAFKRKASNVSQSGVSIHVTDEWNRSLDLEADDVFLPVPKADENATEMRKRGSVYDLCEFLDMLNADDSPLRRRLSSVSSASSKSSESECESHHPGEKSDTKSAGANESIAASRPQLSPRQDSGGSLSLYDLSEFLSLLNTDDSPLRRRLSSASDLVAQENSRTQKDPSEKSSLYSLGEILTVLNDLEQTKINENVAGESELGSGDEISIPVPLLPAKNEKTNTQAFSARKRLTSQKPLKSVPERSEVKTKLSL